MASDRIEIRLYQDVIPEFIEASLEKLYENVFSSLAFLRSFNRRPMPVHTYVLEKDGVPHVVLLFTIEGSGVKVLNESMPVSAQEIERFASYIFSRYPQVDMISLNAIRTGPGPISYPSRRFTCLEDIVVHLPASQEEYHASLSKTTRKTIKRYLNKTRHALPTLEHQILAGEEIQAQHVQEIVALNQARMQRKQKLSTYDATETEQITELAQRCGFLRIMRLNGAIVAGELCTRIGSHYFAHLGAHDPAYDEYSLGTLNCYLTICDSIARGGKQFHFLWVQYDYKYSLRGVQQELNHVALYRSQLHLWLNASKAMRLACKAFTRSAKSLIQQKAKEASAGGHLLNRLIGAAQRLKKPLPAPLPVTPAAAQPEQRIAPSYKVAAQVLTDHVAIDDIFEPGIAKPQRIRNAERSEAVCGD